MICTTIEAGSVLQLPSGAFFRVLRALPANEFEVIRVCPLSMGEIEGGAAVFTSKFFMRRGALCWNGEQWAKRVLEYNADRRLAALEAAGRLKPLLDADSQLVKRIDMAASQQTKAAAK